MMKNLRPNRVFLLASLLATSGTVPAIAEQDRGHPPHGGHHMQLIMQMDADQNGTITQVEIDAAQQQLFSEFDDDNSATLGLNEFEQLWMQRMRHRMVDKFQRLDEDGDGQVTRAEFDAPLNNLLTRRDQNNDGVLSQDELRPQRGDRRRHSSPPKY